MKLLVFSQHFYPENFRINEIVKSLRDEYGYQISVVTGKPNYPLGKLYQNYSFFKIFSSWNGVHVYRVPIWLRGSGGSINLTLNYISYIFSAAIYSLSILHVIRPQIIFCYATSPLLQAIPAILYAKIFKVKVVLNVQDLWPESLIATGFVRNKFLLNCVTLWVEWIYKNVDLILVQSNGFVEKIAQYTDKSKIRYWPNSVDSIFFLAKVEDRARENILINPSKFTVMFAGNVGLAQSIETIVDAAKLLDKNSHQNIQIVIVGDGSQREIMVERASNLNLSNIHFIGHFPMSDMPKVLRCADVLLVSLSDCEIFSLTIPNKVQAYMASRLPIIACLRGDGAKVIQSANCGLVVEPENPTALAQAILSMKNMSKESREMMGSNGGKYFKKHFIHEKLIADLHNYLKELV